MCVCVWVTKDKNKESNKSECTFVWVGVCVQEGGGEEDGGAAGSTNENVYTVS